MPELWHWTCVHSAEEIGQAGWLLPISLRAPELVADFHPLAVWMADLVWLTDDPGATRGDLGLTSETLGCDRMAHRYRVTEAGAAARWLEVLRAGTLAVPRIARTQLHAWPAQPGSWWISREPVAVTREL